MPSTLRLTFLALAALSIAHASGALRVRIYDTDRHTITAARVNVIGPDSAYYEPADNPLAEYSLKRKGNRGNVGPLRYFGSFFYTDGTFEVQLPAGIARIEVSKGYAYYPSLAEVKIDEGRTSSYDVVLQRVIDMPAAGWHSTDTHLHFDRASASADAAILQLVSAEDIELGHILTIQSAKGWAMSSLNSRGRYSIVSGREATSPGLGHVNMLLFREPPPAVRNEPHPPSGFPLASLYDQVLAAGGAMQHDHAGYGQEIYADTVLGKSDAVELIQFGLYRPAIGLDGYYLLLNSGFRYPLLGASDYPVCRAMSDSRTFVADGAAPSFPTSVGRILRGQSFATSGPLLFLSVNGQGPGGNIAYSGNLPQSVTVKVEAASGELPFNSLEVIENGKVVEEWHGEPVFQKELKTTLKLSTSAWIAARCSGPQTVHAHTNPVWIYFNGQPPFQADAARELASRIRAFEQTNVSQAVKDVAEDALARLRKAPLTPAPVTRFAVSPVTVLLPPVLPRPKPLKPATIEGTVTDKSGQPLAGVQVSARATGPSGTTNAIGRFTLPGVDANLPLFLRLTKSGYASTNTAYLNPRGDSMHIVMLPASPQSPNATIMLGGAIAGRKFTASPAGTTQFTNDGIGTMKINFQPAYPAQPNDHDTNVIVSAEGAGQSLVLPVFAGQVTYARFY